MKKLNLSFFIFGLSCLSCLSRAAVPLEQVFTCKNERSEVSVELFIDPSVYCYDRPSYDATLLRQSEHGSLLYTGKIFRNENDNTEKFRYRHLIDDLPFVVEMHFPFEIGVGIYTSSYDEVIELREELDCVMRQIHVECVE